MLGAAGRTRHQQRLYQWRIDYMIDQAIDELAPMVGTGAACSAVGRTRQTHYRWHRASSAIA
jgi:hypothetical protein